MTDYDLEGNLEQLAEENEQPLRMDVVRESHYESHRVIDADGEVIAFIDMHGGGYINADFKAGAKMTLNIFETNEDGTIKANGQQKIELADNQFVSVSFKAE